MDLKVFDAFLAFLAGQFNPVSLSDVENALAGRGTLPPHAMLVTFDDGWEDTARYAAPALHARKIPSVVFVTSNVLTCEHTLWRDVGAIIGRLEPTFETGLYAMSPAQRNDELEKALDRVGETVRPLMMRSSDMPSVVKGGMAIGAHGVSHTPLTDSDTPDSELRDSKSVLEAQLGQPVSSFAFPHGRYDPSVLQKTLASGYQLVFTSDPILNALKDGRPASPVFGRVAISEADITDNRGNFSPETAIFFLTQRRAGVLDRNSGSSEGYN